MPTQQELITNQDALTRHQILPSENPYWEFTNQSKMPPFTQSFCELTVQTGTISQFDPDFIARFINENIETYISEGLFPTLPKTSKAKSQLTSEFISGFSKNHQFIIITNQGTRDIIGGCIAIPGRKESINTLSQSMSNPNTSLPTLWSLQSNNEHHLLNTLENQTVCFSRFFLSPKANLTRERGLAFSKLTLSQMALQTHRWAQENDQTITTSILDTHDPHIVSTLEKFYGGQTIDLHTSPSNHMDNSILRHHYIPDQTFAIVGFEFNKQIKIAKRIAGSMKEFFTPHKELSSNPHAIPNKLEDLTDSQRVKEFKESLNKGHFLPIVIIFKEETLLSTQETITTYEQNVLVLPKESDDDRVDQLKKLFERFNPTLQMSQADYQSKFRQYLSQWIPEDVNLHEWLDNNGAILYLPEGLTQDGQLIVEKSRYFPEHLQYEILKASEWELMPDEPTKILSKSRQTNIGLSVGSEGLAAALAAGITNFDLLDPGTIHEDAEGRLGEFGFDRDYLGVNKTIHAMHKTLKRYPYAKIRAFPEGLTEQNRHIVFNPSLLEEGGLWIINEEADEFENAKVGARKGAYDILDKVNIPWHLIMLGDVGHKVTFSYEKSGDLPFHGHVANADSQGDVYGKNLVKEKGVLAALFASVGGYKGLPTTLLNILASFRIGQHEGAEITRVPQSREATLLAAAAYSSFIRMIALGQPIKTEVVLDIRKLLRKGPSNRSAIQKEIALQRSLSRDLFGKPKI